MKRRETEKEGGTAFPMMWDSGEGVSPGMTMRQYYKAAAMQGLLTLPGWHPREMSEFAGAAADAMLAEDAEHAARSAPPSGEKEGANG